MYYEILLIILSITILTILSSRFIIKIRLRKKQFEKVRAFKKMNKLNEDELKIFETVMRDYKNDLLNIIILANKSDLTKNQILQKAINASQALFKDLMVEPKNLVQYADLLYKILPSLVISCGEYNNIFESDIYTDLLKKQKSEILSVIEELGHKIICIWEDAVEHDLNKVKISQQALESKGLSI